MLTLPTAATPAARSAGTSSPPHTTPYTAGGEVASGGANNKSGLGSYRLGWTAFVPLAPDNSSAAEDNPAARRTDTTDLQMLQDDHTKPACRPLHLNCHQPLTPHQPQAVLTRIVPQAPSAKGQQSWIDSTFLIWKLLNLE